jgi:hypothetical protein
MTADRSLGVARSGGVIRVKLSRSTLVPVLLAAGLLTAACGGAASSGAPAASPSEESMSQILPAMQAAVDSAQSVHVAGTSTEGSQSYSVDLSLAAPGSAAGSVSYEGKTLTLVVADSTVYVEVNSSFLQFVNISPPDCGTLCGKYVAVPASDTSNFTGSLSMATLFKGAFSSIPSAARDDTADIFVPITYNGQQALKASFAGVTVVVAQGAKPYPLQVSDVKYGDLVFSEWNSVPSITAPPPSDVVSLSSIGGL